MCSPLIRTGWENGGPPVPRLHVCAGSTRTSSSCVSWITLGTGPVEAQPVMKAASMMTSATFTARPLHL